MTNIVIEMLWNIIKRELVRNVKFQLTLSFRTSDQCVVVNNSRNFIRALCFLPDSAVSKVFGRVRLTAMLRVAPAS